MNRSGFMDRYTGAADHLRNGFRSMETEHAAPHPVESIQRKVSLRWSSNAGKKYVPH
jgi:hypothetical protein